jgi:hypothetical protein
MADRFADEDRLRRLIDQVSSGNSAERRRASRQLSLAYRNGDRAKRRFIVNLLYESRISVGSGAELENPPPVLDSLRRWMKARVDNWPVDLPPPNELSDWEAARQYFGVEVSHDAFRKARESETPPEWRRQGPRKAAARTRG